MKQVLIYVYLKGNYVWNQFQAIAIITFLVIAFFAMALMLLCASHAHLKSKLRKEQKEDEIALCDTKKAFTAWYPMSYLNTFLT